MARRAFGNIRKLPSGRFQARYEGPDGAQHRAPSTFAQKRYAEAWLAAEDRLIASGGWKAPARRVAEQETAALTVGEYVERVIARREKRARRPIAKTTADLYRKDWKNRGGALADVLLADLTPAGVSAWWDSMGSTPTQDGRTYDLLKSVMAEAVEDELLDRNPCRVRGAGKPEPKRKGESLSIDEVLCYLAAVPEAYRLALMCAVLCGLRSGEVRGLRRRDVDLAARTLKVEQAVSRVRVDEDSFDWRVAVPKTLAGRRTVAMPSMVVEALGPWLDAMKLKDADALVFPAKVDPRSPMSDSNLRHAHEHGRRALSRPKLTVHDLRRTAATIAAQNGATTAELMRLLGHTTVQMAMTYQTAEDARDRERAARLDEALGEAS